MEFFPLLREEVHASLDEAQGKLEYDIRVLLRRARIAELTEMNTGTDVALRGDVKGIQLQCMKLLDLAQAPELTSPSVLLCGPLEHALHALVSGRTKTPEEQAPTQAVHETQYVSLFALYLAGRCVLKLPVDRWTLPAVVQLLFGLAPALAQAAKEEALDTAPALRSAITKMVEDMEGRTREVLAGMRGGIGGGLERELVESWLAPGTHKPMRSKTAKLFEELMNAPLPEWMAEEKDAQPANDEETEVEEDDDRMDLSSRLATALGKVALKL